MQQEKKLHQLKEQFTRLTGVEAKAKPVRKYLKENHRKYDPGKAYELACQDFRTKKAWNILVEATSTSLIKEAEEKALPIDFNYKNYYDFVNYLVTEHNIANFASGRTFDSADSIFDKKAFKKTKRKLLRAYHPDLNPEYTQRATEITSYLNNHFEVLEKIINAPRRGGVTAHSIRC